MNAAERLERDNRIMRRHGRGATKKAIAEEMGITSRQVQRIIASGKEATDRDTKALQREFSSDAVDPYDRLLELVDQLCDAHAGSVRIVKRNGQLMSEHLSVLLAEDRMERARTEIYELVEACRTGSSES